MVADASRCRHCFFGAETARKTGVRPRKRRLGNIDMVAAQHPVPGEDWRGFCGCLTAFPRPRKLPPESDGEEGMAAWKRLLIAVLGLVCLMADLSVGRAQTPQPSYAGKTITVTI